MTKPRKKLTDTLATEFVYGSTASETAIAISTNEPEATVEILVGQPDPISNNNSASPQEKNILTKLLETTATKEATIRFTVDMPESMHRKLSILAARLGKKKAEIVRLLLENTLSEVDK